MWQVTQKGSGGIIGDKRRWKCNDKLGQYSATVMMEETKTCLNLHLLEYMGPAAGRLSKKLWKEVAVINVLIVSPCTVRGDFNTNKFENEKLGREKYKINEGFL